MRAFPARQLRFVRLGEGGDARLRARRRDGQFARRLLDGARARLLAQRARDVAQLGDQAFLPILFLPILRPERANTGPPADVEARGVAHHRRRENEAAARRRRRRFAAEPEAERALASEAAENGERASSAPSKPLAASGDANISLANALWREEGETPWSLAARGGATPGGTQARVASAERESGLEGGLEDESGLKKVAR